MRLMDEAKELIRTRPMDLKTGHLKTCLEALDTAYLELRHRLTRGSAANFTAHCARLVIAIDLCHDAGKQPAVL